MLERSPQIHLKAAQRRLASASAMYRQAISRQYEDSFLEFADVAMLVWSAGIDLISALMLLDNYIALSTSTQRRLYLRNTLAAAHPRLGLRDGWRHLAHLHNFQHNLDMPQSQFEPSCRGSGQIISELNGLLPEGMRLPPESYNWLLSMD